MPKLVVFNSISLDGYFVDAGGDMSWAHNARPDAEWNAFVSGNASSGGMLVFGRKTYQMMASFWPTPMAQQQMPAVADGINAIAKVVFSKTLTEATWNNTRLVKDELTSEIERLKRAGDQDMTILGSGSLVAQLAPAGLIDEFQFVMIPVVLGGGRTLFDGLAARIPMKLTGSRTFANQNVWLRYEPAG